MFVDNNGCSEINKENKKIVEKPIKVEDVFEVWAPVEKTNLKVYFNDGNKDLDVRVNRVED